MTPESGRRDAVHAHETGRVLRVRRSAWRMWGLAVIAIPMLVAGLDMLTRRRITDLLRELLFRPEDTQLPEPRETVWAVALVVIGLGLAIFGLKELLSPSAVLTADGNGVRARLFGPLRRPWFAAWEAIDDVGSGTVGDEGARIPVVWLRLSSPSFMPVDPWGARALDDQTLAILASDWDARHVDVANAIGELAAEHARKSAVDAASVSRESNLYPDPPAPDPPAPGPPAPPAPPPSGVDT